MKLARLAVTVLFLPLLACASSGSGTAADAVELRERQLASALADNRSGAVSLLVDRDFSCTIVGLQFAIPPAAMRSTACAGIGHRRPPVADTLEALLSADNAFPRTASSSDVKVVSQSADQLVVTLEQSYSRWFPYDAAYMRRSRLTDTWMLRGGQWRLIDRVSEPLN